MLKKGRPHGFATVTVATVATLATKTLPTVATVASVAVAKLPNHAANDPTVATVATVNVADLLNYETIESTLTADLPTAADTIGLPTTPADSALIDIGTVRPASLTPALLAASLALDAQIHAAGALPGNDADRWCYPSTTAMNGAEIDTFTARLGRFTDKGATQVEAETLADKLVQRDRDTDTRTLCLECQHLQGYGAASWRCGNWQAAGIGINPRSTQLAPALVYQLQRCTGFASTLQRTEP